MIVLFSIAAVCLSTGIRAGCVRRRRQAIVRSARAKWELFDKNRRSLDRTQMLSLQDLRTTL